jgi:glyoxylase-like metal-dependent hydrolase (beta-lactamase superfamily II)
MALSKGAGVIWLLQKSPQETCPMNNLFTRNAWRASVLLSTSLIATTALAQFAVPDKAKVQKVADGLHVVMGVGGNIAVSSGADGVFMVDDDMPPVAGKIAAAIATITDQPVDMVFNTHWHFDHTGGNQFFGEQGALIIAHDNVRARMAVDQQSLLSGSVTKASPDIALPVVTFDNEISFHMNGQTIVAKHVKRPAHTDGDAIIYFTEANVIHMGDNFFNGLYPVVDISAGGTADGMIAAMDAVIAEARADTVIIPGHGPVSDIEGLKAFRAMLDTVNKRIRLRVEEGKTADEVVALQPTVDYDADWAWDFMPAERWTRLMYDSVVQTIAIENLEKQ